MVDSLQTSVAATATATTTTTTMMMMMMMMAAVPAGVKHQNGRLDYCCYGECFLVHTGQAG